MSDYATLRRVMVDTQVRPSDVTKFPIIQAMLTVPREAFLPNDKAEVAYISEPIDIAPDRTVLAARTFAKMVDALNVTNDMLVLDIGCGYGYSTAVLARIAEAVVAVEEETDLAAEAPGILSETGADNVVLHEGPLTDGAPEHGPYDAIILEGGIEELPAGIEAQLKEGGALPASSSRVASARCGSATRSMGISTGDMPSTQVPRSFRALRRRGHSHSDRPSRRADATRGRAIRAGGSRMALKHTFVAAGLSLAATFSTLGAAKADTLADALVGAYNSSGLLEQNRALLRAADEDVAQAVAALRPVLDWTADITRQFSESRSANTLGTVVGSVTETASIGISASLLVYDFGRTQLSVDAAKQAVLATRYR